MITHYERQETCLQWGVMKILDKISADAVAGMSALPEICLCDILKSARHKTMQNTETYRKVASP